MVIVWDEGVGKAGSTFYLSIFSLTFDICLITMLEHVVSLMLWSHLAGGAASNNSDH
jgi:hypothetical protein